MMVEENGFLLLGLFPAPQSQPDDKIIQENKKGWLLYYLFIRLLSKFSAKGLHQENWNSKRNQMDRWATKENYMQVKQV